MKVQGTPCKTGSVQSVCVATTTCNPLQAERALGQSLSGPVVGLLESMPDKLWPRLHQLCNRASFEAAEELFSQLEGFDVSPAQRTELQQQLDACGLQKLEAHLREAALTRISRMKDRSVGCAWFTVLLACACGIHSVHNTSAQCELRLHCVSALQTLAA
jgi:hypothetical protein